MRLSSLSALALLSLTASMASAQPPAPQASQAPPQAPPPAPNFTLPKPSYTTLAAPSSAPPATPDEPEECFAPAEGLYAPRPKLPAKLQQEVERYGSEAKQRIGTMWFHAMPRSVADPWMKKAFVTIRFAILPDGSIDPPLVTISSGRTSYDHHALDAIRQASPFNPLPTGDTQPLVVCMHFGYHVSDDELKPKRADPLPYPTKTDEPKP